MDVVRRPPVKGTPARVLEHLAEETCAPDCARRFGAEPDAPDDADAAWSRAPSAPGEKHRSGRFRARDATVAAKPVSSRRSVSVPERPRLLQGRAISPQLKGWRKAAPAGGHSCSEQISRFTSCGSQREHAPNEPQQLAQRRRYAAQILRFRREAPLEYRSVPSRNEPPVRGALHQRGSGGHGGLDVFEQLRQGQRDLVGAASSFSQGGGETESVIPLRRREMRRDPAA